MSLTLQVSAIRVMRVNTPLCTQTYECCTNSLVSRPDLRVQTEDEEGREWGGAADEKREKSLLFGCQGQSRKARLPIEGRTAGIHTNASDVQFSKANLNLNLPMWVTESGKVTDVSEVHSWNAPSPMRVMCSSRRRICQCGSLSRVKSRMSARCTRGTHPHRCE